MLFPTRESNDNQASIFLFFKNHLVYHFVNSANFSKPYDCIFTLEFIDNWRQERVEVRVLVTRHEEDILFGLLQR